jgi:dTMP kinase
MFFSFDGIDGVGKSTQMRLFVEWLAERGLSPVTCRDPGSTPLGEQIRSVLLTHNDATPIGARSEMLLYMAARAQLVDEVIRPALERGKVVVSDRYLLANIVYQAHAGGLDVEVVRQVGAAAIDGVTPDCTFLLDMDPAAALGRMARELDRVESRGDDYRQRLRTGFLTEARKMGGVVHIINAARDVDEIRLEIQQIAATLLDAAPTR